MTSYIDSTKIRLSEQASAPATPAAGTSVMYVKTDGLFYTKDDAGTETLLGASHTISGDTGSDTISNGENIDFEGANGLVTAVTANKVTFSALDGGRMNLIASGSLSGVSTLSITSIPATYRHLRLYVYVRGGNASLDTLILRAGTGGSPDSTAGNYSRSAFIITGTTPSYIGDIGATANLLASASIGLTGYPGRYSSLVADFNNYANSAAIKMCQWTNAASYGATATEQQFVTGRGHWTNTAAIDSLALASALGSNFASESVYSLYGIK